MSPLAAPGLLAVIDMQNVFADPDSPWRTPRFDEVVEPIGRLVSAFGERTVFTRFLAPERPTGAWRDYYDAWPFALQPPDSPLYQVVDAFRPGRTIDATTFGKWGPELAALLGDDPLVLAGVSTDCCVLSTALAAADAGVRVRVVADACAGLTDDTHRQALAIMGLYAPHIHVASSAELLGS